jgi:acyl-coenzyme A synthetase/AMP-(fatty) acid ligase
MSDPERMSLDLRGWTGKGVSGGWLDAQGFRPWADVGAQADALAGQWRGEGIAPGEVVVVPGDFTVEAVLALLAAARVGAVAAPLRGDRSGAVESIGRLVGSAWVWAMDPVAKGGRGGGGFWRRREWGPAGTAPGAGLLAELRRRDHPGLILLTGGTTGQPKAVLHDGVALAAGHRMKPGPGPRVLPLMHFDHIGGIDMTLRALAGGQILVAPPAERSPEAVATVVAQHRVEVLAATPTWLNLLLLDGAHRRHDLSSLRLLAFGAEPVSAELLRRLDAAFPGVARQQKFGTSETGAIAVRDAGGTALRMADPRVEWRVVEGELWLRSPARALGYLGGGSDRLTSDGWFRTGDLVEELPGGVLRIRGRAEETINVGGQKVLPAEVEAVLAEHPAVAEVQVRAEPNALLGQVPVAEVVWRESPAPTAVEAKRRLREWVEGRLPPVAWPVRVRLVGAVDTTPNLKKSRSPL